MKALWYIAYAVGLLLNVGGVYCALRAYARTFQLHGRTAMFPRLAAVWRWCRGVLAHVLPFLRQDTTVHVVTGEAHGSSSLSMRVDGRVVVADDAPLEVQIRALKSAIESLDRGLVAERDARGTALAEVHERVAGLEVRFTDAVERLDAKLYSVGVDSLRLQILGVSMVILGTTVLGVLSVISPASL